MRMHEPRHLARRRADRARQLGRRRKRRVQLFVLRLQRSGDLESHWESIQSTFAILRTITNSSRLAPTVP